MSKAAWLAIAAPNEYPTTNILLHPDFLETVSYEIKTYSLSE